MSTEADGGQGLPARFTPSQEVPRGSVVVALPAEIDLANRDRAYDRLYAAFASGAAVVIADFTGTVYCDCSSLRRLKRVQHRAAACDAELRLVIPPGGLVHRVAQLMDLDQLLHVYPSLSAAAGTAQRLNTPSLVRRATGTTTPMADISVLRKADRLHILRWQTRLGELRRRGDPASRPDLAAVWETLVSLIDLHMSADDEICGPAIYPQAPQGWNVAREVMDDHEDIRELIRETSLQPAGLPLWSQLATATLAAWDRQMDQEEHSLLADCLRSADPAQRDQLARQWRAFREAWIRDRYPEAPPQLPTCQLRVRRPGVPRLIDPAFSPLGCTCQDCTNEVTKIPSSACPRPIPPRSSPPLGGLANPAHSPKRSQS